MIGFIILFCLDGCYQVATDWMLNLNNISFTLTRRKRIIHCVDGNVCCIAWFLSFPHYRKQQENINTIWSLAGSKTVGLGMQTANKCFFYERIMQDSLTHWHTSSCYYLSPPLPLILAKLFILSGDNCPTFSGRKHNNGQFYERWFYPIWWKSCLCVGFSLSLIILRRT